MTKIYYLNYENWCLLSDKTNNEIPKDLVINHSMVEVYTPETLCKALNDEDVSDMGYFICVQENEANDELEALRKEFEQWKKESIKWSIDDFYTQIQCRREYDEDNYDETKFQECLEMMIQNHDANVGIDWTDIDYYLDEYCKKEVTDDTPIDKGMCEKADDHVDKMKERKL